MAGSTWRLALRIARRDARRAKGRSALVVAMIALPILGATAADLALRSGTVSAEEQLERDLGQSDASFEWVDSSPVAQNGKGDWTFLEDGDESVDGETATDEAVTWETSDELVELAAPVLPSGSTVVYQRSDYLRASTAHGVADIELVETEADAPITEGMRTLLDGRYPEAAGETAVTSAFLDESGLAVGDELTVNDWGEPVDEGTPLTIVGEYEIPLALDSNQLVVLPDSVLLESSYQYAQLLVSAPDGTDIDWAAVRAANEHGFVVLSRAVLADPPAASELAPEARDLEWGGGVDEAVVAVAVVAVSLIVLEICLLAGPAFAVSARRSRRQLGLVGANGGDRRHLRAIMLASGVVLGAVAAVVGLVGGVLLVLLTKPWLEGQLGQRFGAWEVRPLELAAIAALAVLIGLLAAVIPAFNAARSSVLASLTGRRGVRRGSRVLPLVGASALVLGTSLALLGGLLMANTVAVAAGAVIAELGLVALTPALVGAFGRLARWLPLTARMALRDAARNRGRTAPAVAAVLAAVAGAVAVATVLVSDNAQQRAGYEARLPANTAVLTAYDVSVGDQVEQARSTVTRELQGAERFDLAVPLPAPGECREFEIPDAGGETESFCGQVVPFPATGLDCPAYTAEGAGLTVEERREALAGPPCTGFYWMDNWTNDVLVVEPATLAAMGVTDPAAREALADGEALVAHPDYLDADGLLTLGLFTSPIAEFNDAEIPLSPPARELTVPGRVLTSDLPMPAVLLSPEAAEGLGLALADSGSLYRMDEPPSGAVQQAVDAEMERLGGTLSFYAEEGFEERNSLALLILAAVALVVTIGAAGIATGLAQADAEADLATLSAVGATPRMRRTLAGLQCGLIAFMGVLLGAVSGLVPALGLRLTEHRSSLDWWQPLWDAGEISTPRPELFIELPWATFAQLLIVVPLVAWLLATLLTRSRVPLARRAG
ncbi:FtsX-like permease family protein [Streptomyces sp. DSM 44915]|uniref:FtsX-like permease family protein n=1 Tax=Streptomyces chisholmiae TaxID=3075540 RepID=A0ABU2JQ51_9ACTN|nr:FtsX-like permease family protein [Streptomyces sp. DSM 44915]MDT0267037.1 FtsX-like permease family protein [Streptomyces sp. DSM 44915]